MWKRVEVEDIRTGDKVTWYNGNGCPPEKVDDWDQTVTEISDEYVRTKGGPWATGWEQGDDNDLHFWKWAPE